MTDVSRRRRFSGYAQWVIVVAGFLLHLWAMGAGYFHMDDFLYLSEAGRPFVEFTAQIYNGHLMPLGFAIVWFSQFLAPMSWALAVLTMAALWVLFLVGALVLMRWVFDRSPWTWVTLSLLAFSPLLTTVTVWYASALQILPWGAGFVWLLYFVARHAVDARARWVVAASTTYIIALGFWEKSMLIVPCVLILGWRYWPGEGRWGLRSLGRRWWMPLSLIAITAVYAVIYFLAQPEGILRSSPSLTDVVESVRISLGEVFVPGFFGAPWTGFAPGLIPVAGVPWWAVLLCWQVALVVVIVSVLRWRPALNVWVLIAVYAAGTVLLFSLGRINAFGVVLAYDPRYVEDLFVLASVCLPFAFLRPRESALTSPRDLNWLKPYPGPLVMAATAFAFANLLVLPSIALGASWHDPTARDFIMTAEDTLRSNPGVPVLDRKVPTAVMAPLFLERANAAYILKALKLPVVWNGSGDRLVALADDGSGFAPSIAASATTMPGPDGDCGWSVVDQPRTITLDRNLFPWTWVGSMDYLASGPGVAHVGLRGSAVDLVVQEGLHTVWFVVVGEGDTLTVTPPEGVGLCVASGVLGQIEGAGAP